MLNYFLNIAALRFILKRYVGIIAAKWMQIIFLHLQKKLICLCESAPISFNKEGEDAKNLFLRRYALCEVALISYGNNFTMIYICANFTYFFKPIYE